MQGSPAPAEFPAVKLTYCEQEQNLRCPRCESTDTKFCYYNNYNLSQPRHFCKSCRRYWTKGGALRNVPIGGGTRKNSKRSTASSSSSAASNAKRSNPPKPSSASCELPNPELISTAYPPPPDPDRHLLDMPGSFSSLLGGAEGAFDGFLGSFAPLFPIPFSRDVSHSSIDFHGVELPKLVSGNNGNGDMMTPAAEIFDKLDGDSGSWASGWTDLAVYSRGSNSN